MSYKFNRGCWVESWVDTLGDGCGYPSTVQRITLAGKLFAEHRDALRGSTRTASLLSRLERDLEASVRMMLDFGIVEACSRCDEQAPEGSCCSRGLEEKIDPVTLIANLLLGVELPERRLRGDSCFFLGPRGCLLHLRHMLCVDYLCPELERELGRERLHIVQEISGREIESAFHLQEEIKRILLA